MTHTDRLFAQNTDLKSFRDRYEQEDKEKAYTEAFERIKQFARVVSSMPQYMNEILGREITIQEKEKHIRMVIDLMESVRQDELKKFNDIIYNVNIKYMGVK